MSAASLLPRGFKTWCEKTSCDYRREFGLPKCARLDPRMLAGHIGVNIWTPIELPGLDKDALNHLLQVEPDSWSAVTITVFGRSAIIINSSHPETRRNNSIAHEIAHLVLKHQATQSFITADGMVVMKEYNKANEEEAICLAATLLVPREGLVHFLLRKWTDEQMAVHFGVSQDLLRMRKNVTGVIRQLARTKSRVSRIR